VQTHEYKRQPPPDAAICMAQANRREDQDRGQVEPNQDRKRDRCPVEEWREYKSEGKTSDEKRWRGLAQP
jgi:hypothetical protein